jgi:Cu2+-containing amine oxidase
MWKIKNVNNKNNCSLKPTGYKVLTNNQKTQVFETDGSEDEETATNHRKSKSIGLERNEALFNYSAQGNNSYFSLFHKMEL